MITDYQILHKGSNVLLGIATENAVLDVLTNAQQLKACLQLLGEPHVGLVSAPLGAFGIYAVTLSLGHDDIAAIFIDGPDYDPCRTQSAGIWSAKEDLQKLLLEAVEGLSS